MAQPQPVYQAPGNGLIYTAGVDNGANFAILSQGDSNAYGRRPLGAGRLVPAPAPSQAPINAPAPQAPAPQPQRPAAPLPPASVPAPAAAANQLRAAAPPAPANIYPQRPAGAPMQAQAPQGQQQVPQFTKEAADKYGTPAGLGIDCSNFAAAVGGEVKQRIFTYSSPFCPANTKTRSLSCDLKERLHHILKYKRVGSKDGTREGDLKRVVVLGIDLYGARNDSPTTLVFKATGAKGRDYDWATGERGLLVMPPGYTTDCGANPRRLHLHAPTVSLQTFKRFGNLQTRDLAAGIYPLRGTDGSTLDWSMVDIRSPIVEVIRASHDTLKGSLQNVKITENHMPVRNDLIKAITTLIEERVKNFPGEDFSSAQLSFSRASECNLCQAGDYPGDHDRRQADMQMVYNVWVKIGIHYVIMSHTAFSGQISTPTPQSAPIDGGNVAGNRALPAPQAQQTQGF